MSPPRPAPGWRLADGASTVEYTLLIAAVAMVLLAVVLGLASIVKDAFSHTSGCLGSPTSGATCATSTP
ncbi:MAG TPA: hypothetical protein VI248_25190 [Kineosporiaceae bacterium]